MTVFVPREKEGSAFDDDDELDDEDVVEDPLPKGGGTASLLPPWGKSAEPQSFLSNTKVSAPLSPATRNQLTTCESLNSW